MYFVFVSNYINHHQKPFCDAMCKLVEERTELPNQFVFIETCAMEEERKALGWQEELPEYVLRAYESEYNRSVALTLMRESSIVMLGQCEMPELVWERLRNADEDRITFENTERIYKTGQYKAISPRGLWAKFQRYTKFRKQAYYLLCAGGYVASDFRIVKAFQGKMYKWGYFPQFTEYDVDKLLENKGYVTADGKIPYLLWVGRFIDWKHTELAIDTAGWLKNRGLQFHMDIVGGGELEDYLRKQVEYRELTDVITFTGPCNPVEVRAKMEKADILLFTSDRQEGWGVVANEAMNSACVVVADNMIGAVPYLIQNGRNGCVYTDGRAYELYVRTKALIENVQLRKAIGKAAYETIADTWNAEVAARNLLKLSQILWDKNHSFCIKQVKPDPLLDIVGPASVETACSEKEVGAKALR